jgi:hypothetical protein
VSTIVAFIVAVLALQPAAPPPAVKGARVSLLSKPQAVLNVTIENRRDNPLIWWQLRVKMGGPGGPGMMHSATGSIQSGGRQTVPVQLTDPQDVATATLAFVEYDDGFYEGTAQAVQAWRKTREERAKDLSYWVGVFGLMPRVSEAELRRYLSDRASERAGVAPTDPSGVRTKLAGAFYRHPSGPDVWDAVDRVRVETQAALAWMTRELPGTATARVVETVSSAAIAAQELAKTSTFVAAIENLRDVPIEAVGFEVLEQGSNRRPSSRRFDYCLAAEQGRRPGRIQPKEIREEAFGMDANPDKPLPGVRLSYVLFDDLSFEGATDYRDELFRSREVQADDYASGIAALRQIATVKASEVDAFLTSKRAERARQLQTEGRRGDLLILDNLIRNAKQSTAQFLTGAKARLESLERAHQRLIRHKSAAGTAKH